MNQTNTESPVPPPVSLTVEAPDAGTAIRLYGPHLEFEGEGIGQLTREVRPGIYLIRFQSGNAVREVCHGVEPGVSSIHTETLPLAISCAAPLQHTATSHEYHQENASKTSAITPEQRDAASTLYLFVRDFTAPRTDETVPPIVWRGVPATGLTLHRPNGTLIYNFAQSSQRSTDETDSWQAKRLELVPGSYRLRVDLGTWGVLEQTLTLCHNWETQVFLLRRVHGEGENAVQRADLASATILMSAHDTANKIAFAPDSRLARLTEVARQALDEGRDALSDEIVLASVDATVHLANDGSAADADLREMLKMKFSNPMLGILGAHLLLARAAKETDAAKVEQHRKSLRVVAKNLQRLAPDHPDVMILASEILEQPWQNLSAPPMLRASWMLALLRSAQQPALIPATSLASKVASSHRGGGAWLLWRHSEPIQIAPPSHQTISKMTNYLAQSQIKGQFANIVADLSMGDGFSRTMTGLVEVAGGDALTEMVSRNKTVKNVAKNTAKGARANSWLLDLAELLHEKNSIIKAVDEFADRKQLDALQADVLAYIVTHLPREESDPKESKNEKGVRFAAPTAETLRQLNKDIINLQKKAKSKQVTPFSREALVKAFGLPPQILGQTVRDLLLKLLQ